MSRKELAEYLSERFNETGLSIDQLTVLAFPYLDDPLRTVQEHARRLENGSRDLLPSPRGPRPNLRANVLRRTAVCTYFAGISDDEMVERVTAIYSDFKPVDLGDTVTDIATSLPKLDRVDRGLVASAAHTLLQKPKYQDS